MENVEPAEPLPAAAAARSHMLSNSLPIILWNIGVLIAVLIIWQLMTIVIASRFFPGPLAILRSFFDLAANGDTGGGPLLGPSWGSLLSGLVRVSPPGVSGR